jgi:hypothetical protein
MVLNLYVVAMNAGPGIATDLFAQAEVISAMGDGNAVSCPPGRSRTNHILVRSPIGRNPAWSLTGTEPIRLPPLSNVELLPIKVTLRRQPTSPLHLKGIVGSQDSPPVHFEFQQTAGRVFTAYQRMVAISDRGHLTPHVAVEHVAMMLGISPDALEVRA